MSRLSPTLQAFAEKLLALGDDMETRDKDLDDPD